MEIEIEVIKAIQESVSILNHNYTQLAQLVAVLQTDVAWLKWIVQLTLGAVIITLIGTFWNIVLNRKKNKK